MKITIMVLLFAVIISTLSCKKNSINVEGECISGKVLALETHCNNIYFVQLDKKYANLGKTVEHDGKTYAHVIRFATGHLTLYDGLWPDENITFRMRMFIPEDDAGLTMWPSPCSAHVTNTYAEIPIYVATAIGSNGCP